jgi:signal transduction histidine kinase
MGERFGPKWQHGRWQSRGFRPPWWPENEPFPPTDGAAWRGMRRRFLRRVVIWLALFFGVVFLVTAVSVALLSGQFDRGDHERFVPFFPILALGLVVAFVIVARAVRRTAGPVGDVMEAADRVAAGDYTVQVEERGPGETRRLARAFNAMTERLRVNEEQRRNLLADLAHELRTPLSVIQGSTEGMIDGLYPPDRAHLEPLLEEIGVMARLLDDLRTLSTAEAGALQLHREAVLPERLTEDAVAAYRAGAGAAGITLEVRIADGLPDIDVDPVRIGQVLANLLSNAVRHTPAGGSVVISAGLAEGGVAFAVEDSGPGIPPNVLPHVFDRFVKAGDSRGAGLGLAIAKALVEAHGGTIGATSEPGRGATIRFVLPVQDSSAPVN